MSSTLVCYLLVLHEQEDGFLLVDAESFLDFVVQLEYGMT